MSEFTTTREDAEKAVKFGEAMERLLVNRDFKKVFIDGYFKNEAARLATAITNYEMQDELNQREIEGQFRAIGHMQNYILEIKKKTSIMRDAIKEAEEEEINRSKIYDVDPITGDEFEVTDEREEV
jgi:hypothetical protein